MRPQSCPEGYQLVDAQNTDGYLLMSSDKEGSFRVT